MLAAAITWHWTSTAGSLYESREISKRQLQEAEKVDGEKTTSRFKVACFASCCRAELKAPIERTCVCLICVYRFTLSISNHDVSTQILCDLLRRYVKEKAGERALPSTASVAISGAECVKINSRRHRFLQAVAIEAAEQESATR